MMQSEVHALFSGVAFLLGRAAKEINEPGEAARARELHLAVQHIADEVRPLRPTRFKPEEQIEEAVVGEEDTEIMEELRRQAMELQRGDLPPAGLEDVAPREIKTGTATNESHPDAVKITSTSGE